MLIAAVRENRLEGALPVEQLSAALSTDGLARLPAPLGSPTRHGRARWREGAIQRFLVPTRSQTGGAQA
jgi:hypothetical protein